MTGAYRKRYRQRIDLENALKKLRERSSQLVEERQIVLSLKGKLDKERTFQEEQALHAGLASAKSVRTLGLLLHIDSYLEQCAFFPPCVFLHN